MDNTDSRRRFRYSSWPARAFPRSRIGKSALVIGGVFAIAATPLCQPALRAEGDMRRNASASPNTASTLPALRALCFAAGTFADSTLRPIAKASDDARAVADALLAQRGQGAYSEVDVHVVAGKEATSARFERELDDIGAHARAGDVVVIYLCGYEAADDDARTRLMTFDTRVEDMDTTAPILSRVHQLLAGLPAGHALVLLDLNHGNPIAPSRFGGIARGYAATKKRAYDPGITNTDLPPTVRMLFSATGQEVALDTIPGRTPTIGAFAASLSDALRGGGGSAGAGTSMLTASDVCRLVQEKVVALSGGTQHPYVPYLSRKFDDFPLVASPHSANAQRPAPR